jgi:clan AA aspartic protease
MGKVMIKMKLTNHVDQGAAARGFIPASEVRSIEIDGLVDTGAVTLALPTDVVEKLGLPVIGKTTVSLADKTPREVPIVALHLEILGRPMVLDAFVLPTGATPLIGQIPLERLDLLVDPKSQDLIVNPASPDMPLLDLLSVA